VICRDGRLAQPPPWLCQGGSLAEEEQHRELKGQPCAATCRSCASLGSSTSCSALPTGRSRGWACTLQRARGC
jgi:hypothetical protein